MIFAFLHFFFFINASASHFIEGKDIVSGKQIEISSGKKGLVAVFLSAKCPCSNSHIPVLQKLTKAYPDFQFVGIHSNADELSQDSKGYFQNAQLGFPIIDDQEAKWADTWHALKTPHAFLFDPSGNILYKGGVTNSAKAENAKQFFLQDALAATQSNQTIAVTEGRTLGCIISRGKK